MMIKAQSRVVAFSDGLLRAHFTQKLFIGAVFRGYKILEGVLHGKFFLNKGGLEGAIVDCLQKSRFRSQIRLILLDSVFFSGVKIDLNLIYRGIDIPVAAIQLKLYKCSTSESRSLSGWFKIHGKKIYAYYRGIEGSLLHSSLKAFSDKKGTITAIQSARAIAIAYNKYRETTKRIN